MKFLVELNLEESIEDWLDEMRWKRNHDYKAFKSTLSECTTLLREEIEAERERCAKICDKEALWQKQEAGIGAARKCASLIRSEPVSEDEE